MSLGLIRGLTEGKGILCACGEGRGALKPLYTRRYVKSSENLIHHIKHDRVMTMAFLISVFKYMPGIFLNKRYKYHTFLIAINIKPWVDPQVKRTK